MIASPKPIFGIDAAIQPRRFPPGTSGGRARRNGVEARLNEHGALARIVQTTSIAFADAWKGFAENPYHDDGEPHEIIPVVNALVFGPMIRDLIMAGNEAGEQRDDDPEKASSFLVAIGTEAMRLLRADPSCRAEPAAFAAKNRIPGA